MANETPGRRVFRPRLWPTLVAIPMLAVLLALGTWQARRHGETTAARELYHRQHDLAPTVTSLGGVDGEARLHDLHFRRATLQGTLEPEHTQLLTARYVLGHLGYGVTMPLRVSDGVHKRILVDLGRVPTEGLQAYIDSVRANPKRTLSGRLQVATEHNAHSAPAGEQLAMPTWRSSNPAALARSIEGLEPRLMLVVGEQASGKVVDTAKIPADGYVHPVRMMPAKHIEYAATWYGLALTLIAIWLAFSVRRREP